MHFKEINIKNRVYKYYFDNLIKGKKLETKNTLTKEKNYKDSGKTCFSKNVESVLSWISSED